MSKKFLSPIKLAQGASNPSSGSAGEIFYNTTDKAIYTHDGTGWGVTESSIPAGTMVQWGGSTAPTNWLLCDGTAVSRTTYATLFAAIGTSYGVGDGSTTFNLPDLRGRVPVGKDGGSFGTLGATGGSETVTLTEAQMPSHTHVQNAHTHVQDSHNHTQNAHAHTFSGTTSNAGSHNHAIYVDSTQLRYINTSASQSSGMGGLAGIAGGADNLRTGTNGDHNHTYSGTTSSTTATNQSTTATNQNTTATNQNTGGGQAHNNLQPYQVVNYIIKATSGTTAGDSPLTARVSALETTTIQPVALGGTGASTASAALTNLGAAAASHTHAASSITSGNIDYARMPSGSIIQAITSTSTTQVSGANGWNDTGLTGTITPKLATSRFIVIISLSSYSTRGSGSDTGFSARILRNGTQIWIDYSSYGTSYVYGGSSAVLIAKSFLQVNDYTGSAAALTFNVQFYTYAGGTTYFQYGGSNSQMTILEVAP